MHERAQSLRRRPGSRNPSNAAVGCTVAPSVICLPNLNADVGNAIVASQNIPGCDKLQVDAQQFYSRGTNDAAIDSAFSLCVLKNNLENEGD